MAKFVEAGPEAQLTLRAGKRETTVDLYSDEGYELLAALWTKVTAQFRRQYEISWLGVPIIQFPDDIIVLQELIWRLRPDVVVECGIAHGGALLLYATVCDAIGHGRVIGIDVEIRTYNRVAMEAHPMSARIELIEGSSVAPETFAQVQARCDGARRVLVLLDSNHSADHVARELELYHTLVTPGSYLVAMDGAQGQVYDIPAGRAEWREDNPLPAIHDFIARHPEFEIDDHFTRLQATSSPDGFLRRRTLDEMADQNRPAVRLASSAG